MRHWLTSIAGLKPLHLQSIEYLIRSFTVKITQEHKSTLMPSVLILKKAPKSFYPDCWLNKLDSHKLASICTEQHHVKEHDTLLLVSSGSMVKPSLNPSLSTSVGLLPHIGQSLFLSREARIHMIRFQRVPEEMGRAPCMCWPLCSRPSVTWCSTSTHSVSLRGT